MMMRMFVVVEDVVGVDIHREDVEALEDVEDLEELFLDFFNRRNAG